MIKIEWEQYVGDHLRKASDEILDKNEIEVGRKLPESLKRIMKEHGGQTPLNLIPKYPSGNNMTLECIYHAYFEDEEDSGYTIPFGTSALADEGYINYVAFSYKSNVFLCLDYNIRDIEPPVVMVIRDSVPEDPEHRFFLAENFDEFIEKYTVPMSDVD